ncbi:MAG: DUF4760 domain-containing protein [Hyphomicrobiaceae bacterium]
MARRHKGSKKRDLDFDIKIVLATVFFVLSAWSIYIVLQSPYLVDLAASLPWYETAAATSAVALTVAFIQTAVFYTYRSRRTGVVLLLLVLFFTVFFANLAFEVYREASPNVRTAGLLAIMASWVATIGWVVTNYLAMSNARVSHTLNAILQLMTSKEFQENRRNIFAEIPYNDTLSEVAHLERLLQLYRAYDAPDGFTKDRVPAIDSIRYVFNYLEYLARGVRAGEFDKKIIAETISPMIERFYADYRLVFWWSRVSIGRNDIYDNLEWLLVHYGVPMKTDRRDLEKPLEAEFQRRKQNGTAPLGDRSPIDPAAPVHTPSEMRHRGPELAG